MPEEEPLKTLQRYASLNRDQFTQYSHGIRAKLWPWGDDMYTQTGTKPLPYLLKLSEGSLGAN